MTSRSILTYEARAKRHPNALAKKLFEIASSKQTNVVLSADVTTTRDLLSLADSLGPYIAVLKTHIDIINDFTPSTATSLQNLSTKHNFLLFEDRKFIDIGSTVQKQYTSGIFGISSWAHIVNASVLAGEGIIDALSQSISSADLSNERAVLILAEMTSKGSLATNEYTSRSVDIARQFPSTVIGFVATRELSAANSTPTETENEDFVVFTTGVNLGSKGDALGQQYQTPASAMARGADFIIAGRGIYAATDPVVAVKQYQEEGWKAYLSRTKQVQ
ncbi:MAG: hypothetical protein Q9227_006262 [Pyrenula ochraceoflavens]